MSTIRNAQKKDIPKILELLLQVDMVHHRIRPDIFKGPVTKYTDADLETILADESTPVFVSTDASDCVEGYAFCVIKEHRGDQLLEDGKEVYLDDLCVDAACRGKHIGTALYEYVKTFARQIGARRITLNVWEGNDSALAFYRKQGMAVQKTTMEEEL
ncbi:MAG: GNAT family N-acetyltransferase [Ruminococcaceae bacterium]|nr:GNAT family N-acetyltransferase [Oscillospiraceae bacterium]